MPRRFIPLIVLAIAPTTILAQEKPARVDQAGDALPPGALARLGTVRLRQPDFVRSMAVSPDGKTLASAGDSSICLWEMPSGQPLKTFPLYRDKAGSGFEKAPAVAFSAKGELVALGNHGTGSVLYDPASGKELKRFKDLSADVLSADGRFAVFVRDKQFTLWDMTAGKEIREVPKLEWVGGPLPATLSADGKVLAIGGPGIRRVDTGTGKELPAIRQDRGALSSPAFSRDGKLLAAVMSRPAAKQAFLQDVDSDIVVWDADSGKELRKLKTYNRYVRPLAFSADGKFLAAGLGDMTYAGGRMIVLLDTATGKELDRPTGHEAGVYDVVFVAGTNTILSACEHDTLRTWDATTGKQLREVKLPKLGGPTFSPDGKLAASFDGDRIHLRDLAADKMIRTIEDPPGGVLLFSPDAKYLAAWATVNNGDFKLYETATGKELTQFRMKEAFAAAFSPDSKFIVRKDPAEVSFCRLTILELPTSKELRHFKAQYDVGVLAVSPDGKFLAASHRDQTIVFWDLTNGEKVWQAKHPARDRGPNTSLSFANPIAVSPDGKLLASGGDDHAVRLWDVATGKELRKFAGHEGTVRSLAFSSDGKMLTSASDDTTVLIWEVAGK